MNKKLFTLAGLLVMVLTVSGQGWNCGQPTSEISTVGIDHKCWILSNVGFHSDNEGAGSYYTFEQVKTVCGQFGEGWSLPSLRDLEKLGSSHFRWTTQTGGYISSSGGSPTDGAKGYWWGLSGDGVASAPATTLSAIVLNGSGGVDGNSGKDRTFHWGSTIIWHDNGNGPYYQSLDFSNTGLSPYIGGNHNSGYQWAVRCVKDL